jgi:hypothetical protein
MEPIEAARASLLGLAVGDAFGAMLDGYGADFARRAALRLISRKLPWRWTDDTAMALSIVELLERDGTIHADVLARAFVRRFEQEPDRGYGAGAYGLLSRVSMGASSAAADSWRNRNVSGDPRATPFREVIWVAAALPAHEYRGAVLASRGRGRRRHTGRARSIPRRGNSDTLPRPSAPDTVPSL